MVIQSRHLLLTAGLLVLIILSGIGFYLYLRPTDEKLIRAQFAKLAELTAKNGKEGAIPAAGKARTMAALFSEKTTFAVDAPNWMAGPFSRKDLSANIFRSRAMFTTLKLSLDDLELNIDPGKGTAQVFLSATLSGTLKDGNSIREVRELESRLTKTEEGWLFESFKVREIIKK